MIAGVAAVGCAGAITAGAYAAVGTRPAGAGTPTRTAAVTSVKKGVSVWVFRGLHPALSESGASWYFNWQAGHSGITNPRGVQFVPMIWGAASVTRANLREARHQSHYLLGFNEPDSASQSNLTVARALHLWPRLMSTGMTLGRAGRAFESAGS